MKADCDGQDTFRARRTMANNRGWKKEKRNTNVKVEE